MKPGKRIVRLLMAVVMMLTSFLSPLTYMKTEAASNDEPLRLIDEQMVSEGVKLLRYIKTIDGKASNVYVTQVDLNNPYVKIAPLFGKNEILTDRQSVENMANEKGAVAAVNADFFNMNQKGAPFGIVMDEGDIISSMGHIDPFYSLGITQDNTALITHFGFQGEVEAPDGTSFPLRGINKEPYNPSSGKSHENQLNLYTPYFGKTSLGPLPEYEGDVVEMIVRHDKVTDIEVNQPAAEIPEDGYVLWGHGEAAQFLQNHFERGDTVKMNYRTTPDDVPVVSAVGGHALLVDRGQVIDPIVPNVTGLHPRAAAGVSEDGRMLYLVTVDGVPYSRGMTLEELAGVMVELGAWRAFNLDGGGSATMVARQLGDSQVSLVNVPKYGSQRSVPTAVGIFNTAPKGEFAGIVISGPQALLKGSTVTFSVKGYDEHYHPYPLTAEDVNWSVEDRSHGQFENNRFTASSSGTVNIRASYKGVEQVYPIRVLGPADIDRLIVAPSRIDLREGDQVEVSVKVRAKDGTIFDATPESVSLSVDGSIGSVDGFTFYAGEQKGTGTLTASYEGVTTSIPVRIGTMPQPWLTFDNLKNMYHTSHPTRIADHGSFKQTDKGEPVYRTEHAAKLSYNFSQAPANDVRIAYGRLGNAPMTMPGHPLKIGVWVYGDNSGHWLRAEVYDSQGKRHFIDLAEKVNWEGWRYVTGDIPYDLSYPIKLNSLYLVNLPEDTEQRPEKGTVYFDELVLYQPYEPEQEVKPAIYNLKDTAGDMPPFSLGREMSVKLDAESLRQITGQVELTPVSIIPMQIPGVIPVDYGFELYPSGHRESGPMGTGVDVVLNPSDWPDHVNVGLMYLDPATGWKKLKGSSTENGTWVFNLNRWGLYLPYYEKNPFQDTWGHWAESAIKELYDQEVIQGVAENRFAPDSALTRAQFVTLLDRLFDWNVEPESAEETSGEEDAPLFQDQIPEWALPSIEKAALLGIAAGYEDQTFRPGQPLNRVQMAVFLSRALAVKQSDEQERITSEEALELLKNTYQDWQQIPGWAQVAVADLTARGLMQGSSGRFNPDGIATRAQAAQLLYNLLMNAS
ncbi:MAG: phosphodiester glycosidase family protein [Bacillaceae bacterium]|nr:phosphodiester glycosidase family protein [Bacillaceae bacterium]